MIIPRHLRWLWLTLGVVFLDRATKAWIESRPGGYFPRLLIPNYVNIVSSRNPGIAFSFFADSSSMLYRWLLIVGSVIIIAVIAWLLVASRNVTTLYAAGLALLLGGATGNLTDRIIHGAVTDFLEVWVRFLPWRLFNPWPVFNVADSAITIGAFLIIVDSFFRRGQVKRSG
jgi:signal peptidase II